MTRAVNLPQEVMEVLDRNYFVINNSGFKSILRDLGLKTEE